MNEAAVEKRGIWARIGLCVLHLHLPGLSLLRMGKPRLATLLLVLPAVIFALIFASYAGGLRFSFCSFVIVFGCATVVILFAYLGGLVLTWRESGQARVPIKWWSRWYSLISVDVLSLGVLLGLVHACHSYYHPYYMPSASMLPTLTTKDNFYADMRDNKSIKRGDVIILLTQGHDYIKRIAALEGDHIALKNGMVILNGKAITQQPIGKTQITEQGQSVAVTELTEQFPGEAESHHIYSVGDNPAADDFSEVVVPRGHVFVLGDNRDRSADSRFPLDVDGTGMVANSDIEGKALFIYWSADHSRIGKTIH